MKSHMRLSVGGRILNASSVELFPSESVTRWRGLMGLAQQQMGGVSTGIGFWGSPGWAIGGALALGALESALSTSKAKEGVVTLQKAQDTLDTARRRARMFSLREVENISLPDPSTWAASGKIRRQQDMSKIALLDRGRFLKDRGLTKADVKDGSVIYDDTTPFIALGDDFLRFIVEGEGEVAVRWSAVTSVTFR